ncbi:ImmA/IrrE family metallo-endopeptidase [Gloeocapsa sp. BRSZ]
MRSEHGLTTPRILRSDLRRIYKIYDIQFDLWPTKGAPPTVKLKSLRGAFFCDEYGVAIMVNRFLPDAPAIFTMAHEFKHFLVDREFGTLWCGDDNQNEKIEIGAEVFAAELMFPEQDFRDNLIQMGIRKGECTPEVLVRLKRETQATLSYTGLVKKAEFLGFAPLGSLAGVKWQQLEEQIYGKPVYKQIQRRRGQT